jgi:hypothetical protein
VEPSGAPLGPLTQELIDEAIADVTGVGHADPVELHDRPLVARGLTLDADQAGDAPALLVDVHEVIGPERTERQAEEAEDADGRATHRQAERSSTRVVGLAQA